MFYETDDLRIKWTKVVLPPVFLEEELPETETASSTIYHARKEIVEILNGQDHRLLVVVGPCSIHDTKAAREYAALLKGAIAELSSDLRIVMRVYFEKPRTTVGWKGLLNDPHLDQSFKINDGLRLARHLLLDLGGNGRAGGHGISGHDFAAIRGRTGELGRDRGAHHREPGSPAACLRAFLPGGIQERHVRRRADRDRGHSFGRPTAYISGPHEARTIGDLCDHRQSGLPRDPARRQKAGELYGRCGEPSVRATRRRGAACRG